MDLERVAALRDALSRTEWWERSVVLGPGGPAHSRAGSPAAGRHPAGGAVAPGGPPGRRVPADRRRSARTRSSCAGSRRPGRPRTWRSASPAWSRSNAARRCSSSPRTPPLTRCSNGWTTRGGPARRSSPSTAGTPTSPLGARAAQHRRPRRARAARGLSARSGFGPDVPDAVVAGLHLPASFDVAQHFVSAAAGESDLARPGGANGWPGCSTG